MPWGEDKYVGKVERRVEVYLKRPWGHLSRIGDPLGLAGRLFDRSPREMLRGADSNQGVWSIRHQTDNGGAKVCGSASC